MIPDQWSSVRLSAAERFSEYFSLSTIIIHESAQFATTSNIEWCATRLQ